MTRFKYRLQRVRDARDAMVSRCEVMLAEAERAVEQCRREHDGYQNAIVSMTHSHAEELTQDAFKARDHAAHGAWVSHLVDGMHRAARAMAGASKRADTRREELAKALMDSKILENMSRRERALWVARMLKQEQQLLDEQGGARWLAQMREKAADRDGSVMGVRS